MSFSSRRGLPRQSDPSLSIDARSANTSADSVARYLEEINRRNNRGASPSRGSSPAVSAASGTATPTPFNHNNSAAGAGAAAPAAAGGDAGTTRSVTASGSDAFYAGAPLADTSFYYASGHPQRPSVSASVSASVSSASTSTGAASVTFGAGQVANYTPRHSRAGYGGGASAGASPHRGSALSLHGHGAASHPPSRSPGPGHGQLGHYGAGGATTLDLHGQSTAPPTVPGSPGHLNLAALAQAPSSSRPSSTASSLADGSSSTNAVTAATAASRSSGATGVAAAATAAVLLTARDACAQAQALALTDSDYGAAEAAAVASAARPRSTRALIIAADSNASIPADGNSESSGSAAGAVEKHTDVNKHQSPQWQQQQQLSQLRYVSSAPSLGALTAATATTNSSSRRSGAAGIAPGAVAAGHRIDLLNLDSPTSASASTSVSSRGPAPTVVTVSAGWLRGARDWLPGAPHVALPSLESIIALLQPVDDDAADCDADAANPATHSGNNNGNGGGGGGANALVALPPLSPLLCVPGGPVARGDRRSHGFQRPLHPRQLLVWAQIALLLVTFAWLFLATVRADTPRIVLGVIAAPFVLAGVVAFVVVSVADPAIAELALVPVRAADIARLDRALNASGGWVPRRVPELVHRAYLALRAAAKPLADSDGSDANGDTNTHNNSNHSSEDVVARRLQDGLDVTGAPLVGRGGVVLSQPVFATAAQTQTHAVAGAVAVSAGNTSSSSSNSSSAGSGRDCGQCSAAGGDCAHTHTRAHAQTQAPVSIGCELQGNDAEDPDAVSLGTGPRRAPQSAAAAAHAAAARSDGSDGMTIATSFVPGPGCPRATARAPAFWWPPALLAEAELASGVERRARFSSLLPSSPHGTTLGAAHNAVQRGPSVAGHAAVSWPPVPDAARAAPRARVASPRDTLNAALRGDVTNCFANDKVSGLGVVVLTITADERELPPPADTINASSPNVNAAVGSTGLAAAPSANASVSVEWLPARGIVCQRCRVEAPASDPRRKHCFVCNKVRFSSLLSSKLTVLLSHAL